MSELRKPRAKTWVEISSRALTSNVKAFRSHLSDATQMMAVVKSNAYGHGLVETATIADAAGAAFFGVDNVDEGISLRKAGIKKPVLILGYTLKDRLLDCVKNDLSFVVYNLETATALKKLKLRGGKGRMAKVHLKIETGTTRQGVEGDQLRKLARALKSTSGVVIEGASTHYANIEEVADISYAEAQLKRFQEAVALLHAEGIDPPYLHTACSAAAILFPRTYFNLARVGISMYGLWPSKETKEAAKKKVKTLSLKPVLTWKTVVAQLKKVKKGTAVSYDLTEKVSRDSVVAVLPIGYWDDFDRGLSGIGHVLIHGRRCKVLGRICMNMCMVDVTGITNVRIEDEVVILGKQKSEEITAEEIASQIGTINYEVVTRINPMLPRIVV